ncbi:MAG: hypothetical protein IT380_19730 [Myxococcales bacterium]|nr:hypothetical protein [Myxococcales bacterium]
MRPLRLFWLLVFAVTGCAKVAGDALKVTLRTAEAHADTCFEVEVRDEQASLASTRFPREQGRTSYVVAVARDFLPRTVRVSARALAGADCASATLVNGVAESVSATFDPQALVEVPLSLEGGDGDGDGFVSIASGGLDCDDGDERVFPAAEEQCSGLADRDCDGRPSCSDESCAGRPCAGVGAKLAFVTVPASVRPGACSGALDVEVRDAMDVPTSPSDDGPLTVSGPVTFFAGGACAGAPLTGAALEARAVFSFIATAPGPVTLTASAPGLSPATATVEALSGPPSGLALGAQVRATVGACSPQLVVGLVDDGGFRSVPAAPVVVSLSSDAGAPFGFYADLLCTQAISSLVVFDGGEATFHFQGQRAGAFQVRAESPQLGFAEQAALLEAGAAATVQLAPPDGGALPSATCVGPFVVSAVDAFGNPLGAPQVSVDAGAGVDVFTSAACTTPGGSASFGAIFPDEGAYTLTATVGGVSATQTVLVRHPGPQGSAWRWPLAVSTGARAPQGGYDGYTLLAAFDSRADVDAGRIDATGSNLRLFFRADGGWRELDRLVEGLDTASTAVRFRSQTDLPDNTSDGRYSLFAGPFDGGAPAADPSAVYLFFDDFEGGSLGKWTIRSGTLWALATDQAHSGASALRHTAETDAHAVIEAQPALAEADVLFEAWWRTSNTGDTDFSQCVRMQPGELTQYESNVEDTAGWNIARMQQGAWAELSPNRSPPAQGTWMRIGVSIAGRELRVWRAGAQITPASGAFQVPTPALGGGNVGFRKWDLGGSLWLDDVSARRYTEPEPAVVVGAPFLTP